MKENMQEIALPGLRRAKFFKHATFYAGTYLWKKFHHRDRNHRELIFYISLWFRSQW